MKAVCIIASDGVAIDGDVVFIKNPQKFDYVVRAKFPFKITENGLVILSSTPKGVKLKALWFWHMVVLRKSHVYLTGVLRK